MFEILKLLWDVVVLRDAARKGQLNWRIWPVPSALCLSSTASASPRSCSTRNIRSTSRTSSPL